MQNVTDEIMHGKIGTYGQANVNAPFIIENNMTGEASHDGIVDEENGHDQESDNNVSYSDIVNYDPAVNVDAIVP